MSLLIIVPKFINFYERLTFLTDGCTDKIAEYLLYDKINAFCYSLTNINQNVCSLENLSKIFDDEYTNKYFMYVKTVLFSIYLFYY